MSETDEELIYNMMYTFELNRTGDIELKHMSLDRNEDSDPEPMPFGFDAAATSAANKALIKTFIQQNPNHAYNMYVDWKQGDTMLQVKFMSQTDDMVFHVQPKKFYAFLEDLNHGGNTPMPTLKNTTIISGLQDPSTWKYKRIKVGTEYKDVFDGSVPVTIDTIIDRKVKNTQLLYDMFTGDSPHLPKQIKSQMLQKIATKGMTKVNKTRARRNQSNLPDEVVRHITEFVGGKKNRRTRHKS